LAIRAIPSDVVQDDRLASGICPWRISRDAVVNSVLAAPVPLGM